jgi:hypothetical protein
MVAVSPYQSAVVVRVSRGVRRPCLEFLHVYFPLFELLSSRAEFTQPATSSFALRASC